MNEAKIFFVDQDGGSLIPMIEQDYVQEDVLQTLLERYPDLLPGDQINPEMPRRWLLVAREMGVPGDIDESDRWSLDHLFLDQDGVPTFVECKRAADTRSRREVVAQMLDYAANGVEYWTMDRLRQSAAETAKARGRSLDDEILSLIDAGDETEIEGYWGTVEENLTTGRVRLLFVMDRAPKELRRLVEFLNEKMRDVEVLAVEVKQFVGTDGQKVMVPRVLGVTEAARQAKGAEGRKGRTNREEFLANCTPRAAEFLEQVLDVAQEKGYEVFWGSVGFSIRLYIPAEGRMVSVVYGYPPDTFEFYFSQLQIPEEEASALREELLALAVFEEAGEKTLRATLQGDTLDRMPQVYDFILDAVPRVLGMTQVTRRPKGGSGRKGKTNRDEFLANRTPQAAEFFRRILDLALKRGHTVYWGSQGFSVRARLPKAGHLISFVYGWPNNSFEFYFAQLPLSDEDALTLRRELLAFGVFEEAGKKTLRANLNDQTSDRLPGVYDFILDKMDEIVQAY